MTLGKSIGWTATALLLAATFFFGGSAKGDYVQSIIIMAVPAGYVGALAPFVTWRQLRPIAVPLGLLGGVFLLCLGQLVPLPGAATLGGTASEAQRLIAAASAVANLPPVWRPLSLSPVMTWSTLAALFVPAAILIALVRLPDTMCELVMPLLLVTAFASALLGVLQSLSGAESALYYYEFTNRGDPVGVFANRNHQAVFLACGVLWGAYVYRQPPGPPDQARAIKAAAAAVSIILFCCVLLNASRSGLIALCLATIFSAMLLADRFSEVVPKLNGSPRFPEGALGATTMLRGLALPVVGLFSSGLLVALFFFQSKIPAFERVLNTGSVDELRERATPALIDMAWNNLPWGTGMGTFKRAYLVFEPDALLMPTFFNNAHNDWLQVAIEGGLPAVLLLSGALAWIGFRLMGLWRLKGGSAKLAICVGGTLAIFAVASLVDYPLRTPWMLAVVALLIGLLGLGIPTDHANARVSRR